jgi:hypothetical protein
MPSGGYTLLFCRALEGPNNPLQFTTVNNIKLSFQSLVSTGAEMDISLLPLKTFVQEILRRSRTSGSVMQTALCYLEAIRPKVPEILRDEKRGIRSYFRARICHPSCHL